MLFVFHQIYIYRMSSFFFFFSQFLVPVHTWQISPFGDIRVIHLARAETFVAIESSDNDKAVVGIAGRGVASVMIHLPDNCPLI